MRQEGFNKHLIILVRTEGLEPSRGYPLRILSPVCLPVPPRPPSRINPCNGSNADSVVRACCCAGDRNECNTRSQAFLTNSNQIRLLRATQNARNGARFSSFWTDGGAEGMTARPTASHETCLNAAR